MRTRHSPAKIVIPAYLPLLDFFARFYYRVKMEQIINYFESILGLYDQGTSPEEIARVNGMTENQVRLILSYHSQSYQYQQDLSRSTDAS